MPGPGWLAAGPLALLAAHGRRRGPDRTRPTPAEDWRRAVVDVVIPVSRNHHTIIQCLAALLGQSRLPRQVLLVDDGGAERDHSIQLAREFALANGVQLQTVVRTWAIGKAATLKRQSREFTGDVLFVLDADTVLDSPDYIERCVRELYQGCGIASASGRIEPLWPDQRQQLVHAPAFRRWLAGDDYLDPLRPRGRWQRLWRHAGNLYHAHLARLQRFLDLGLMDWCGGVAVPAGTAVAYRRRYLRDLFDRYEPVRGDDLTGLEEQFIGHALATEGYRNIRLDGVVARVQQAAPHRLPLQAWNWTVAQLQSGHYFDLLLRSPLRRARRAAHPPASPGGHEARRIREQYRQPFGERMTRRLGRPLGTVLWLAALERVAFPALLVVLGLLGQWPALATVVVVEVLATAVLSLVHAPPRQRGAAFATAVAAAPLRYLLMLTAPPAAAWFVFGLRVSGRYRWRVPRKPTAPAPGGGRKGGRPRSTR